MVEIFKETGQLLTNSLKKAISYYMLLTIGILLVMLLIFAYNSALSFKNVVSFFEKMQPRFYITFIVFYAAFLFFSNDLKAFHWSSFVLSALLGICFGTIIIHFASPLLFRSSITEMNVFQTFALLFQIFLGFFLMRKLFDYFGVKLSD